MNSRFGILLPGASSRKSTMLSAKGLSRLMAEGPEAELTQTENAQPALMAVSMAVLAVLREEHGIELSRLGHCVAGHSLGEYTALTAAGSFSCRRRGATATGARPRDADGGAVRRWRNGGADGP